MARDFSASAVTAGALISTNTFEIPPFQREYAWTADEYQDFWEDITRSFNEPSYFLGLVILTGNGTGRKLVVDGQQRLLTITLLASALRLKAIEHGRSALASAIQTDFLTAVDFATDELQPRFVLADLADNETLQRIVSGEQPEPPPGEDDDSMSPAMIAAYQYLSGRVERDLRADPFARLGLWMNFLTAKLEFAVFIHPDPASAYRVFEVINTRGRELTTADLLKNYLLSQTSPAQRAAQYDRWQGVARAVAGTGSNTLVQYIRHALTVHVGYVRPKELFDYVARRVPTPQPTPTVHELLDILEEDLPLYLQMIDPTLDGPSTPEMLRIFAALNDLNVIVVRPLLLAISRWEDPESGMEQILNLVVRRIVVGNLGTGNVERRLGEAAHAAQQDRRLEGAALASLHDLDPRREEFTNQLARRSLNKGTLQFLRRSIVQASKTPEPVGWLHFLRPRQGGEWEGFEDEELTYWGSTLGNTILIDQQRRPFGASTWVGVQQQVLPLASENERVDLLEGLDFWTGDQVEDVGRALAEVGADVWY